MSSSRYYLPAFTVIRLEAIWTLRISFARMAPGIIKKFLTSLNKVPKRDYRAPVPGRAGHLLELAFLSIEESLDRPDLPSYPDW